jgi:predicted nucleotide-binding protein (sugar kinase/HSP70/actin superfamily)
MPKISFPHMGPYVHAFRYWLEEMGWEVVMPDRPNLSTLTRGVKHSPEFYCVPFKICLGTYMEVLDRGAEVIITSGGTGPCRAGHYHQVQEQILRRQGYQFEMIVLEAVGKYPLHFLRCMKRVNVAGHSIPQTVRLLKAGLRKVAILDAFEAELKRRRPRELKRGSTDIAYEEAIALLNGARSPAAIEVAATGGLEIMRAVTCDWERPVLRVGLAGEIYVLLEPAANLEIEKMLGELGVEVHRPMTLSGWTAENAVKSTLGTSPKKAAQPYLAEMIGGHGQDTVGHAVLFGQEGFDGFVQLAPFTCIPEIVARGILPVITRDFHLPVLSFFLDEQTGEAGMRTRVEAFVDMLWQKRKQKEGAQPCPAAM